MLGTLAGLLAYGRWILSALFVAAVIYASLPRLIQLATRVQNYPKLLEQVVTLRERLDTIETANSELYRTAAVQYKAGMVEGFARARGALLALLGGAPPYLKAITESEGKLVLVGEYAEDAEPPAVGARYQVQDVYTTEQKGVVEITVLEEERRLAFMSCIDPTVPGFWQQLEDRAPADAMPPANVVLLPMDYRSAEMPGETPALETPDVDAEVSAAEVRAEVTTNGD